MFNEERKESGPMFITELALLGKDLISYCVLYTHISSVHAAVKQSIRII